MRAGLGLVRSCVFNDRPKFRTRMLGWLAEQGSLWPRLRALGVGRWLPGWFSTVGKRSWSFCLMGHVPVQPSSLPCRPRKETPNDPQKSPRGPAQGRAGWNALDRVLPVTLDQPLSLPRLLFPTGSGHVVLRASCLPWHCPLRPWMGFEAAFEGKLVGKSPAVGSHLHRALGSCGAADACAPGSRPLCQMTQQTAGQLILLPRSPRSSGPGPLGSVVLSVSLTGKAAGGGRLRRQPIPP